MRVQHLLAKSSATPDAPEERCTLLDHTRKAVAAARTIVEVAGTQSLRAFGLDPEIWGSRLQRAAELTAFGHDLGKANNHFQMMVRGRRDLGPQGHRHELLSFWLIADGGPLHDWLVGAEDQLTATAALCGVVGHHLKFESSESFEFSAQCLQPRLTFLGATSDFQEVLADGGQLLGLGEPPTVGNVVFDAIDEQLEDACQPTVIRLDSALRGASRDARVFVALVRSLFIAADVAASALARRGDDLTAWICDALSVSTSPEEFNTIVESRLAGATLRPFQLQVADTTEPVTLVRAGCGTGKTIAAYLWAGRHANGRRLFITYPTTGTATEGFADYLFGVDVASGLFHSRATVDLDLLSNGDQDRDEAARFWANTVDALRLWLPKVAVTTADLVLGLFQNHRTAVFASPAIGEGAFVFDEVHQYDERMFSTLCRFITETRGAPLLVMTASLPPARRLALEEAVLQRGGSLAVIDGPRELEEGPRYEIAAADHAAAVQRARSILEADGKVLWVCNTVRRAVAQAVQLRHAGLAPLVYHSRFRYEDRAARHRQVVAAFRTADTVLAVTTQVCEVSLDISADLLISDIATVPAMIQRLGRLNRRFDPEHPRSQAALFLEPGHALPYRADELALGRHWLSQVAGGPRSQREITAAYEALDQDGNGSSPAQTPIMTWLDRLPFAWPAPLRDIEPSIQVVLSAEADACRRAGGRIAVDEVVRRSIPMPVGPVISEYRSWPLLGMAFVPPDERIAYSLHDGARWVARPGPSAA